MPEITKTTSTASVEPVLTAVTRSRVKADLYSSEPEFTKLWNELQCHYGSTRLQSLLHRTAFVVLKPECVVSRLSMTVLGLILERGFSIVSTRPIRLNEHAVQQLWKYQINTATPDREEMMYEVLGATDSLLVGLRATSDSHLPASVRLSICKGPADPTRRKPDHIRSQLPGISSKLLTHFHVPEEPIDVVRELGILLDFESIIQLFQAVSDDFASDDLEDVVNSLHTEWPAHDLDFARSVERLAAKLLLASDDQLPEATRLAGRLRESCVPNPPLWQDIRRYVSRFAPELVGWDYRCVGSILMQMDIVDAEKRLASVDPSAWEI